MIWTYRAVGVRGRTGAARATGANIISIHAGKVLTRGGHRRERYSGYFLLNLRLQQSQCSFVADWFFQVGPGYVRLEYLRQQSHIASEYDWLDGPNRDRRNGNAELCWIDRWPGSRLNGQAEDDGESGCYN